MVFFSSIYDTNNDSNLRIGLGPIMELRVPNTKKKRNGLYKMWKRKKKKPNIWVYIISQAKVFRDQFKQMFLLLLSPIILYGWNVSGKFLNAINTNKSTRGKTKEKRAQSKSKFQ